MTMFRQALTAAAPLSLAMALALALAACGQQPADGAAPATDSVPVIAVGQTKGNPAIGLDPDGLGVVGLSGVPKDLKFGLGQAEAVRILAEDYEVAGKASTNAECGAGPIDFVEWPSGLSTLFQEGKFVGWSLNRRATRGPTTMAGIRPGSTRAELVAAYSGVKIEETTLGQEFDAGGLYGILDGAGPDAKIDAMWAGTSCVFR